jgi:hypothetical protein
LQTLIEQWMMPVVKKDFQYRLAHDLVQALQEHLVSSGEVSPGSAQRYHIVLNPQLLDKFQKHPNLIFNLAIGLQQAAREAGLILSSPPIIELVPDPNLPLDGFLVKTAILSGFTGNTAVLHLPPELENQEAVYKKAFLIVNGKDLVPLRSKVINLGRRADNDLVLDDPRVSRLHAQLRFSRGEFFLFDLNSTGGTSVNGQPVRQWRLTPGDVIGLAGFPLIYGEESGDNLGLDDADHTQVMQPPKQP